VELRTGKVKWEGQHVTPRGQNPHASLTWAGDRALILNAKGELILVALAEILATRTLEMAAGIGRPPGLTAALGSAAASPDRSWPCWAAPRPR
jgi:hypothetical protein